MKRRQHGREASSCQSTSEGVDQALCVLRRRGSTVQGTNHQICFKCRTALQVPTSLRERGVEVDNQVAAPAETRTPNWHRATNCSTKSADGRMATEAARLNGNRFTGGTKKNPLDTNRPSHGRSWPATARAECPSGQFCRGFFGACLGKRFVVSRSGEAYDAQKRGPNREFQCTF